MNLARPLGLRRNTPGQAGEGQQSVGGETWEGQRGITGPLARASYATPDGPLQLTHQAGSALRRFNVSDKC